MPMVLLDPARVPRQAEVVEMPPQLDRHQRKQPSGWQMTMGLDPLGKRLQCTAQLVPGGPALQSSFALPVKVPVVLKPQECKGSLATRMKTAEAK